MLEINKIYNMDCLDGMKYIEDESIDIVITDHLMELEKMRGDEMKYYEVENRNFLKVELNPDYCEIVRSRLEA
jgi:hypothetical protein